MKIETHPYISDGVELDYDVYLPDARFPSARPAIIVFHGGAFCFGTRKQFEPQAKALSSLGYVVFTPDYRVKTRHGTTPAESVADAACFLTHVLENAGRFNIDPLRLALAGASAGGALAPMAAVRNGFQPACYILFNPVVEMQIGIIKIAAEAFPGVELDPLLPAYHLREGFAPILILHGDADDLIPVESMRAFCERSEALGNSCALLVYPGQRHGFFNKEASEPHYQMTLDAIVDYLQKILPA